MEKKSSLQKGQTVTYDATDAIVGRLAAICAKQALNGVNVEVLNIEKAVISGDPEFIVRTYTKRRDMTQKANPEHAAKWPKRPDYLFKAILRGMVPKRSSRGSEALSRIMAHIGVPAGADVSKASKPITSKKPSAQGITVMALCRKLGWTNK